MYSKMRNIEALVLMLWLVVGVDGDNCEVPWISTGHQVAESQYLIDLSVKNTTHGMAKTYFPDTQYDIIIRPKKDTLTFKEFHFKMENDDKSKSYGTLDFGEPELTMFSGQKHCINQVVNSVLISKPNITIAWQSPPRGSGCIRLIAHVKETDLRYHTDELKVCEDERIELDDPGATLAVCSACEYAKYEMTFEGTWSKFTHPRGFPRRDWLAGFPIVVGASHTPRYEIWSKYKYASEGLTHFAVTGSSLALELELKQNLKVDDDTPYPNITTLIKFRGTNFRNTTLARAQLKVDRMNHVVSLLAKIYPSPDWFIGVSSLELCTKNGTWMADKRLNLYAYDVGAKTGLAFEQENNDDTFDVINPMNISWPVPANRTIPPFYDKNNNTHEVRPMAQIYLRLIRTFGNSCGNESMKVEKEENLNKDFPCVTPWTAGECSTTCGTGFKNNSREYQPGYTNETCKANLQMWTKCENPKCPDQLDDACDLMPWSEWGKCAKHCGQEYTQRDRNFKSSLFQDKCKEKLKEVWLTEYKDCGHPPCPGGHDMSSCNERLYTNWTEWTPCSVTVGQGLQYRHRTKLKAIVTELSLNDAGFVGCMYDKQVCEGIDPASVTVAPIPPDPYADPTPKSKEPLPNMVPAECMLDMDEGETCAGESEGTVHNTWYYDLNLKKCEVFKYRGCAGNDNRFDDELACIDKCGEPDKVDCKLGDWEPWTSCDRCQTVRTRVKLIEVKHSYYGKPCPVANTKESEPCKRKFNCDLLDKS